MENPRTTSGVDAQSGSYLGTEFSDAEIRQFLDSVGAVYESFHTHEALNDSVADVIAAGGVVGWFQGRMEFGPRALGHRSILGDARSREMQRVMNLKIKFRESFFRPLAPAVLQERISDSLLPIIVSLLLIGGLILLGGTAAAPFIYTLF